MGSSSIVTLCHTAARRFCQERFAQWIRLYQDSLDDRIDQSDDSALRTERSIPRYMMAKALLIEVERIDPNDFSSVQEIRLAILGAAREAEVSGRSEWASAISDEREAFCNYMQGLADEDMSTVTPLPFRRVLDTGESLSLWKRINVTWGVSDFPWYPIAGPCAEGVAAFEIAFVEHDQRVACLHEILLAHGIDRVWELREGPADYELAVELLDPTFDGEERFWFSDTLDWVVYLSHEDSVTFGGWILAEVRSRFRDWHDHLWNR